MKAMTPDQIMILYEQRLAMQLTGYTIKFFDGLRLQFREQAGTAAGYRARVAEIAQAARVKAFDETLDDVARRIEVDMANSEEVNALMDLLYKSGLRIFNGDVFKAHDKQNPISVFSEECFVL